MSNETAQDALDARDSQPLGRAPGALPIQVQPKPKRKSTDKQRQAGINNLKRFNASRNNKPNMKHGVKSFIATRRADGD